jgi:hypothetical protein
MLKLGGVAFTQGRSVFLDRQTDFPERTAKIYVRLLIGSIDLAVYAQLDTGAAWSVLDPTLARSLGLLERDPDESPTLIDTRFGRMKGHLVRIPIRFLAEIGDSYDTEGTFFISPDWPPGRTFLGYSGLLDSIRFALDPQANHFYFGPGV